MNVECIKTGFLGNNCYLVNILKKYFIIDPGDSLNDIEEFINDKEISFILLTHSHFDHSASAYDLSKKYNIPVYGEFNLDEGINNIKDVFMEVIYTNGHTMDSVCYYFDKYNIMFTGDFLFKGTIGRCDLMESNTNVMEKSINKIKKYADDIVIYPGHGISSTLKNEKKYNPFLGGVNVDYGIN